MVSPKERRHFDAIARRMDALNDDALARAAHNPPGRNIEEAFALSRFVMGRTSDFSRADEVAPISLWRKLHPPDERR